MARSVLRPSVRPSFIVECFSASGGMAEGLRRAGLPVSLAFDFSEDACRSYWVNLKHLPIQVDVRDLVRMVRGMGIPDGPSERVIPGWRPGAPIDLFVADPPCTPWSRAGGDLCLCRCGGERDCLGCDACDSGSLEPGGDDFYDSDYEDMP